MLNSLFATLFSNHCRFLDVRYFQMEVHNLQTEISSIKYKVAIKQTCNVVQSEI